MAKTIYTKDFDIRFKEDSELNGWVDIIIVPKYNKKLLSRNEAMDIAKNIYAEETGADITPWNDIVECAEDEYFMGIVDNGPLNKIIKDIVNIFNNKFEHITVLVDEHNIDLDEEIEKHPTYKKLKENGWVIGVTATTFIEGYIKKEEM